MLDAGVCFAGHRRALSGARRSLPFIGLIGITFLPAVASDQQNGTEAMQRMSNAYQRLSSYSGASTVSQSVQVGSKITRSQSVAVRMYYKRPNRLALNFIQPGSVATRSVYSDGKLITIYDAIHHRSASVTTGRSLTEILQILGQRTRIKAELDPLYFLSGGSLPTNLTELTVRSDAAVNGRPCQVVSGLVAASRSGAPTGKVNIPMHWTWYIDRKTHLINKIDAYSDPIPSLPAGTRVPNAPVKTKPQKVVVLFRYLFSQVQPNAALSDGQFVFKPPRGAVSQKAVAPSLRKAGSVH